MTTSISGERLADLINRKVSGAATEWTASDVWVRPESLYEVAQFLKDTPELDFAYLNSITGVDYIEYFEVVYHLTSLRHNHSAVVKVRHYGRENPTVPTVTPIWQGADFQEREVWDLMGIRFENHHNLRRILLWEEFPGHPLRKDYLR